MPALLAVAVLLLRRRRILWCSTVLVVLVLVVVLGASVRRVVAILTWRGLVLGEDWASVASLLAVAAWGSSIVALVLVRGCAILVVTSILRLLVLPWRGRTVALTWPRIVLMLSACPAILVVLMLPIASLLMLVMVAILAWRWRRVRVVARRGGVRSAGLIRCGRSAARVGAALGGIVAVSVATIRGLIMRAAAQDPAEQAT